MAVSRVTIQVKAAEHNFLSCFTASLNFGVVAMKDFENVSFPFVVERAQPLHRRFPMVPLSLSGFPPFSSIHKNQVKYRILDCVKLLSSHNIIYFDIELVISNACEFIACFRVLVFLWMPT